MRDRWYGDNRDLVKWGVLLTVAERLGARHILQVLYYRPTDWGQIEVDGDQAPLPAAVVRHFRQVDNIGAIQSTAIIEVFPDSFVNRDSYLAALIDRIRRRLETPGIVFLDPDTGLESAGPSLDHVLNREIAALWAELKAGDVLVLYQHQTNRNGQPWIEPKKAQFEQAIGLAPGSAKVAKSEQIARDVAFIYAQKAG
jgi:hypothetical protein